MPATAVIGAQWGDEGKGKIIDYLAGSAKAVARFNGGANSGHTVVQKRKAYKLHLIPSGVLRKNISLILGNGMVVDPEVLAKEIRWVRKVNPSCQIYISDRAHVVMPYHKTLDGGKEAARHGKKIGTTMRGIGSAYAEKMNRSEAFRVWDLTRNLEEKLRWVLTQKERELKEYSVTANERYARTTVDELKKSVRVMKKYVCDTTVVVNEMFDKGENVLLEGAQGTLLDIDHGTFPYVSSSSGTVGGACTGLGISPTKIKKVMGVFKAYTTRVGEGPFPTELFDETGEKIRKVGGEHGTTTGRPRRCGWLDLPMLSYACRINGFTSLAITKLDVLTGIPEIKVCVGYERATKNGIGFTPLIDELAKMKPIYQEFSGWNSFPTAKEVKKRGRNALPLNAQKYLAFIEKYLRVPIEIVSYGADRNDTISS